MSDVPSWLNEDNAATAVKVVSNPTFQQAAKNLPPPPPPKPASPPPPVPQQAAQDVEQGGANSSRPSEFVIEEETLKAMQKWHLALRVVYIGAAVFLAAAAALSLQNQSDVGLAFFAFYVFFFSVLLCCFEFAISSVSRLIAVNFGFMYSLSGRMVFLLFVGFMSYSLSVLGKFAMGFLYACGLFHAYVMYKFPKFEEYLRKKHYYEGRNGNGTV